MDSYGARVYWLHKLRTLLFANVVVHGTSRFTIFSTINVEVRCSSPCRALRLLLDFRSAMGSWLSVPAHRRPVSDGMVRKKFKKIQELSSMTVHAAAKNKI